MIRFALIVIFLGLFFIVSLPIFPVLLLIGLFSEKQKQKMSYAIVSWAFSVVILIAGTRIDLIGYNKIPKDKAVLYLMDISKSVFSIDDTEAYAKEIWMYKPSVGVQFLCSNKVGSPLAPAVNNLYSIVKEFARHPKLGWDIRHVIDAYMRDDMNDDSDELPF